MFRFIADWFDKLGLGNRMYRMDITDAVLFILILVVIGMFFLRGNMFRSN